MKMMWQRALAGLAAVFCLSSLAFADDGYENHFASILLDGKKIGNVHYTVKRNEHGELEELRTKASLSILGVKLYDFSQQLHEQWGGGELQTMSGHTNDDGKTYELTLKRTPKEYEADLNDKPLTLPHNAFPISLWHYAISQQSLLFDMTDLTLMKVTVVGHQDTVDWDGKTIPTERFDFSGEWQGSVWFNDNKDFVKAQYESDKRQVTVLMDP
jgi:Domain of unknown function (DUF6134)